MYIKEFDKWNTIKKQIDTTDTKVHIRAGEIRWVAFGVNVGSEIDGKGDTFTRPALILHVIGSHLALVVPMSTKVKDSAGYIVFEWKGVQTALCMHQVKIVSQKRVLSRKGRISNGRVRTIKNAFAEFYSLI